VTVAVFVGAQFITIFVIQPIGAVPEGRTLVISRLNTLRFIDSADAWCERQQGGVSLLCRIAVMGRVAQQRLCSLDFPTLPPCIRSVPVERLTSVERSDSGGVAVADKATNGAVYREAISVLCAHMTDC